MYLREAYLIARISEYILIVTDRGDRELAVFVSEKKVHGLGTRFRTNDLW